MRRVLVARVSGVVVDLELQGDARREAARFGGPRGGELAFRHDALILACRPGTVAAVGAVLEGKPEASAK